MSAPARISRLEWGLVAALFLLVFGATVITANSSQVMLE